MTTPLSPALARLLAEGEAAWPGLQLAAPTRTAVAAMLAPHVEAAGGLRIGELFLTCACAAGDEGAKALFEAKYLSRVPELLVRREQSLTVLSAVKRALKSQLFVAAEGRPVGIANYGGRGSLDGWLRAACLRVHASLAKGEPAEQAPSAAPHALVHAPEQGRRAQLDSALREAIDALPARDRSVLRQRLIEHKSVHEISLSLGVSPETTTRWLQSARERLLDRASKLFQERSKNTLR